MFSNKKTMGLSIKTKLIIFVLSISLISISVVITLCYFNARSTVKKQTLDWLTAVAESRKLHLLSFLEGKKGRTIDFGSDGFIRDNLEIIARRGTQSHAVIRLNRHLEVNKKSLDSHIVAIAILDIKGNVVASTNERWIGKDMSEEEIFISCINKNYAETYISQTYNLPYLNVNCLFISAPLTSRQGTKTIGIIINTYDLASLNEITTNRIGMGKTGEVYLVNRDKIMLTESRFIEDVAFNQVVDTEPVRRIVGGGTGMSVFILITGVCQL